MRGLVQITILLAFLLLSVASCKKESGAGCFKSAGNVTTEHRPADGFRIIELQDNVDLVLTHASGNNEIVVETGKNLIKGVGTEIENGRLTIKNNNWCNWTRDFTIPLKVYVEVGKLDSLVYRGSGDVYCTNDLHNDSLMVDVWEGSGSIELKIYNQKLRCIIHQGTVDVTVQGNTWVNIIGSHGFGPIDCLGLNSEFTYINSTSPNHCYVYAKQVLSGEISNIGDIYYTGNPYSIDMQTYSSGKLIKLE